MGDLFHNHNIGSVCNSVLRKDERPQFGMDVLKTKQMCVRARAHALACILVKVKLKTSPVQSTFIFM